MPPLEERVSDDGPLITVGVGLSPLQAAAARAAGFSPQPPELAQALIDTGARVTCIDSRSRCQTWFLWAGHNRCPQAGHGASPTVTDGSTQERAAQIGQRRGSPPPHVREETTHDIDRSSGNEYTQGSWFFAPHRPLFED